MQFNIPIAELRKRSLFIATPMYGGQCTGTYCQSLANLVQFLTMHGIAFKLEFLFNESLITRARNYLTELFLQSKCRMWDDELKKPADELSNFTHMIFIDSDIQFDAEHVIQLLWLQSDDSPYDVITAPYPKKNISWEKIKAAVDKGAADQNPNVLENFVGDFVFNMPPEIKGFRLNEPTQVMEAGTGFMMIRRPTLEKYMAAYPEYMYKPDHVRSAAFDGSKEIMCFFDCIIDPETKRYLSEDYFFCQNVRKAGMQVWMVPWINLKHYGSFNFTGSLAAMAQVGVTPTADLDEQRRIRATEALQQTQGADPAPLRKKKREQKVETPAEGT